MYIHYSMDPYHEIFNKMITFRNQSGGQRWNLICEDICNLYFTIIKDQKDIVYTREELWDFLFNAYRVDSLCYIKYVNSCVNNAANRDFFKIILAKAIEDPPTNWWKTIL